MKSDKAILNNLKEETIESRVVWKGRAFSFKSDTILLPDGRIAQKDLVSYPEAVAIIPFIDSENIVLVRQFRYPVGKVLYEIPAGKLDSPDEDIKKAAERELQEEIGYYAEKLLYLVSYYSAPGYSSEKLHIFRAENLRESTLDPDEDEFIEKDIVPLKRAYDMIASGEIEDSKTLIALLYIKCFL